MFMNDVNKKEEIRNIAEHDLRQYGVKNKPKKSKTVQVSKAQTKVFKVPLTLLPSQTVTLRTGQQMLVPKILHELCSYLLMGANTEGIFRKEGSKPRMNTIRANLEQGIPLETSDKGKSQLHVIDVAVILKQFLRELPDPLIPYGHQDVFMACMRVENENKLDAILSACLLLPSEHLNALSYVMQFFHEIAEASKKNKMNASNLAVVIGPSVFPTAPKAVAQNEMIQKSNELLKILIENAKIIGLLPEHLLRRMSSQSLVTGKRQNRAEQRDDENTRKKKRRSGSLTRMFSGLRKIVGSKTGDETHIITPDLLLTPINSSARRRNVLQNGISQNRRKELVNGLPDNALLSTPFTPMRTPVNMNSNGTSDKHCQEVEETAKNKKPQWFLRSLSSKNVKEEPKTKHTSRALLERRWSTSTNINRWKKAKKRNSCTATLTDQHLKLPKSPESHDNTPEETLTEPDYIRVPRFEYEEMQNRVSAVERRISSYELENVQSQANMCNQNDPAADTPEENLLNVQTAYEKTLVQVEQLSPTTDQLVRRFSRELKIRRSTDQKIIRSPSARKIGSIRRRSRELERNSTNLMRHQTWHVNNSQTTAIPRVTLKRSKPFGYNNVTSRDAREAKQVPVSSFNIENTKSGMSCNSSGSSNSKWTSADGFFASLKTQDSDDANNLSDRASIAQIRTRNAGMVLEKAKLFGGPKNASSDSSNNSVQKLKPRVTQQNKIGSSRNAESRMSHRVKTLRYEEKQLPKKSMSPRRRNGHLTQKQKIDIVKQYVVDSSYEVEDDKENVSDNRSSLGRTQVTPLKDCNRIKGGPTVTPKYARQRMSPKYSTPKLSTAKGTPQIKRTLNVKTPNNVKTPKRLCRTPGVERNTPLKVLLTPAHNL